MSNSPVPDLDVAREKEKEKELDGSGKPVMVSRWLLAGLGLILLAAAVGIGALVTKLDDKNKLTTPAPASSVATGVVKGTSPRSTPSPTALPSPTPDPTIKVYVTGEVVSPGVYQMQSGERLLDAINRAGGFTEQADQSRLDLAMRVKDEMRIEVPHLAIGGSPAPTLSQVGMTQPVVNGSKVVITTPAGDGKVNVNVATAAELDKLLPGIGPTLAQRIVDYRAKNGPYKTLDDLRKVQGLSKTEVDKIKDLVSF